jgi:hypothetical protein
MMEPSRPLIQGTDRTRPVQSVVAKPILEFLKPHFSRQDASAGLSVSLIPFSQPRWTNTKDIRTVPVADGDSITSVFQTFHQNLHCYLEEFITRAPVDSLATAAV